MKSYKVNYPSNKSTKEVPIVQGPIASYAIFPIHFVLGTASISQQPASNKMSECELGNNVILDKTFEGLERKYLQDDLFYRISIKRILVKDSKHNMLYA